MDFGNPGVLFSGLLIGTAGFVLFMYGKKQANFKVLFTGLAMCVFPYFVSSVLVMWLITAGCLGGLYAMTRND